MKALTLWNPWAALVAWGYKTIETRCWETSYRGHIAIHAAARKSGQLRRIAQALPCVTEYGEGYDPVLHGITADYDRLAFGSVVAVGELVTCFQFTESIKYRLSDFELAIGDYTPGRFAWVLDNVRPLSVPVPAKGYQRVWNWTPPDDVDVSLHPTNREAVEDAMYWGMLHEPKE